MAYNLKNFLNFNVFIHFYVQLRSEVILLSPVVLVDFCAHERTVMQALKHVQFADQP